MATALPEERRQGIESALRLAEYRRSLPPSAERKAIRRSARLTQEELARALGVDRPVLARWELGIRTPRGADFDAYVDVLRRLDDMVP